MGLGDVKLALLLGAVLGGAVVAAGATTVFERCDFSLNLALAVTAADGGVGRALDDPTWRDLSARRM